MIILNYHRFLVDIEIIF